MSRRSVSDPEASNEKTPGEGISPATDEQPSAPVASGDAPSASADAQDEDVIGAGEYTRSVLEDVEGELTKDRTRQTLIGAMLVARAITFAGLTIARAIRESRNSPS